jgi:CHASE3 domain sensor protein
MELFKLAAKEKYRFPFRGNISVEDLFDLTTSQLDVVYKELKSQVKESSDSLLKEVSTEDKELKNKIEIVKTIFEDKMTEAAQKEQALAKKQRKERIKELIAQKKDQDLADKSIEELEAMLGE